MSTHPDYVLRTYKSAFGFYIKDPAYKMVVPGEYIEPRHPQDCKYCGGVGTLVVFLVTDGPFINPPSGTYTATDEQGARYRMNIIAKSLGGHWYAGKNAEASCPGCRGLGINPDYVEKPRGARNMDYTGVLKETKPVEVVEDYSDI